jgi:hypothetical protein
MSAIWWHLGQTVVLMVAFSLAWCIHYQADFFYGLWYEPLGLEENIDRYGPKNRFKRYFADTDRRERLRVFAAINQSVHEQGQGLTDIRYTTRKGYSDTLLHDAEITHLRDVARLIEKLKIASAAAISLTLLLIGWLRWRAPRLPSLRFTWLVSLVSTCTLVATVLALGPIRVFYHFHDWVFPEDHQWFFYYQDSLMSTLMKAPDLFGAIGASLLAMAIVIYMALSGVLWHWLGRNLK